MNRLIRKYGLDAIYMAGPGHGGPALLANVWLEGSYTVFYPQVTQDEAGMLRLFRQFSTPGGVPSHVSVPTPGSIHEGGELGYVLLHAFGAVMDNPGLLVTAVVGDGESETGPLAGSWKSIDFINPDTRRRGCCRSCTSTATRSLARPSGPASATKNWPSSSKGQGYAPLLRRGRRPGDRPPGLSPASMEAAVVLKIKAIQEARRASGGTRRSARLAADCPAHPEGLDGAQRWWTACRWRARSAPIRCPVSENVKTNPEHLRKILEDWMRSYRPEELFDAAGRFRAEYAASGAVGRPPHGRQSRTPMAAS